MNLLEALQLAQRGKRVRPTCWQVTNADHWVESRPYLNTYPPDLFVECGTMEEIPHRLCLQLGAEFLGEWEELPT